MKVYLHYAEGDDAEKHSTIKLTLPKSWRNGPLSQLKKVLVDDYNKKNEEQLDAENFHLETGEKTVLPKDGIVKQWLKKQQDVFLKPGKDGTMEELGVTPPPDEEALKKERERKEKEKEEKITIIRKPIPPTELELETARKRKEAEAKQKDGTDNRLLCKRFGCQKKYLPEENHEEACRHHVKPPIFHETRKYWACCPDQIAWDWDSFQAIRGCAVSSHSDVREGKSFLGGTDVRAELEKSGPQRIDGGNKKLTSLDKILNLRKTLVAAGVSGSDFDEARDRFKQKHEELGVKVWDKVLEELGRVLQDAIKTC